MQNQSKTQHLKKLNRHCNKVWQMAFNPHWPSRFFSAKQDRNAICQASDEAGLAIFGATTNEPGDA